MVPNFSSVVDQRRASLTESAQESQHTAVKIYVQPHYKPEIVMMPTLSSLLVA